MIATQAPYTFSRFTGAEAGDRPFLSIVTRRHPRRWSMYLDSARSVLSQSSQDYERIVIRDTMGQGVAAANRILAEAVPRGEYVLILDDDDVLTDEDAIAALKDAATPDDPALIVFRADHGPLGVLPRADSWERPPVLGSIGSCDFVARRDVWERHIEAFGSPRCGDYYFLRAIWKEAPRVVWVDRQLASVQRISNGRPE